MYLGICNACMHLLWKFRVIEWIKSIQGGPDAAVASPPAPVVAQDEPDEKKEPEPEPNDPEPVIPDPQPPQDTKLLFVNISILDNVVLNLFPLTIAFPFEFWNSITLQVSHG